MVKLYSDGVLLNNNGYDGPHSDRSDIEEVRKRINAHGKLSYYDKALSGHAHDYFYYLWRDAKRLIVLLDEANKKIADLSRASVTKTGKNDFVLNIGFALDGKKIARAVQAFNQEMAG